jgi:hypothetical protein
LTLKFGGAIWHVNQITYNRRSRLPTIVNTRIRRVFAAEA